MTGNCGAAYVQPQDGTFTLTNNPGYTSDIGGKLLSATGHGHDGVENVKVKVGGKVVCDSQQVYGRRPGYTAKAMAEMPGMPAHSGASAPKSPIKSEASVKHISDTGVCMDFGSFKAGDIFEVDAVYDTKKNGLNKLMGEFVELMGISLIYVAPA